MVASADPVFAQVISEETFRANLAPARAGDLRSIDIVYAYCLQKDMDASADYWERQRDIRESQLHMRDIPPARGRQPALPPPA